MLRGNAHPPPQPLTSLADAALTDGPQVRRFELEVKRLVGGDAGDAPAIRAQLLAWRDNDAPFREIAKGSPDLEAGLPASADTAELAREGLEALDALMAHRPLSAESRARAAETLDRAGRCSPSCGPSRLAT
jgi:hexosaminidase